MAMKRNKNKLIKYCSENWNYFKLFLTPQKIFC